MAKSAKLCRMCKFIGEICVQPKSCSFKSYDVINFPINFPINKPANHNSIIELNDPSVLFPKCTGNVATCTFFDCMCDKLDKRKAEDVLEKI